MIITEIVGVRRIPRGKILAAYLYAQTISTPSLIYRQPQGGWDIRKYAPALRRFPHLHSQYLLAQGLAPQLVTVPNLVGLSQSAAVGLLSSHGLAAGQITTAISASVPAGLVISQNPVSGSSVLTGTSIDFVISLGAAVTMPNLVGLTQAAALAALPGYTASISYMASSVYVAGLVALQSPVAGTDVTIVTPIVLTVSTGSGTASGIMPNLVGLEYLDAILILQQVGILVPAKLGYFSSYPISIMWESSTQEPALVLAQSVPPGQPVAVNSPMTLTVSEFPVSVAFP